MIQRPVDDKCYALANDFLRIKGATEDEVWELAKILQDACEDACRKVEKRKPNDVAE
jgi:hypothetical protein